MNDPGNNVPSHWETVRLSDIAEVRLGRQRSPKRAFGDNMRPYMRAANVTWDGISLHDVKEMDFTPREFETYALRPGDLLLSEASGSASEVGKPALWRDEVEDCCFQNTLIRVRADQTLVPFLHLHFTKDARTGAFASASRGVGIHHLGAKALSNWQVTIPPLHEQHRIVEAVESYLSRLDDAVATLERVQVNLRRYRASVLKAAVEGRLVPTEAELARAEGRDYEPASVLLDRTLAVRKVKHEEAQARGKRKKKYKPPVEPDTGDLSTLPEGWAAARLDAIADVQLGQQRHPKYARSGTKIPYIRAANITWNGLDLTDVSSMNFPDRGRYSLEYGDVLLSEASGSPMEAGKPAIWKDEIPGACFQKTVLRIRLDDKNLVLPEFLQLRFLDDCWSGRFAKMAPGVGIVHLTAVRTSAWPIQLPPLAEQRRIVAEVERRLSVLNDLDATVERNILRSTRLRQSILKWAFEGKLADQDPDDEPASLLLERIRTEREAMKPKKKTRKGRPWRSL